MSICRANKRLSQERSAGKIASNYITAAVLNSLAASNGLLCALLSETLTERINLADSPSVQQLTTGDQFVDRRQYLDGKVIETAD